MPILGASINTTLFPMWWVGPTRKDGCGCAGEPDLRVVPCRAYLNPTERDLSKMLSRLIGIATFALLATSAHAAVVTSGECRTDNTAGVSVSGPDDVVSTTSLAFVDVPNLAKEITTQGAVADCAFVQLSASVKAADGTHEGVRAVLDGVPCDPPRILVGNSDQHDRFETSPAQFICRDVSKGKHVVKIQYRTSEEGLPVYMRNRAFSVGYKGK
jgi:hypothetical protein